MLGVWGCKFNFNMYLYLLVSHVFINNFYLQIGFGKSHYGRNVEYKAWVMKCLFR
jgi:hypothetical protein